MLVQMCDEMGFYYLILLSLNLIRQEDKTKDR